MMSTAGVLDREMVPWHLTGSLGTGGSDRFRALRGLIFLGALRTDAGGIANKPGVWAETPQAVGGGPSPERECVREDVLSASWVTGSRRGAAPCIKIARRRSRTG